MLPLTKALRYRLVPWLIAGSFAGVVLWFFEGDAIAALIAFIDAY